MRIVDLLHRWGGGLLGLLLAVLGLTGAILVHKEDWIALPHAGDARISDPAQLGQAAASLLEGAKGGESLIFASDRLGLIQMNGRGGSGLYASQAGEIVAQWDSPWQRPELWLFDLHHHLLMGDAGETLAGLAGLAAVVFVITGCILWWRTRKTFRLRLWPARMSRPAVLMHHRDLGIVFAPLLLLTALTGSMMIFRPVAGLLLAPLSSPRSIEADLTPPKLASGQLSPRLDWQSMLASAQAQFPDGQIRVLILPRKPGDPVTVRVRRAAEWLPNGRTMVWFDAATGRQLGQRDALSMALGTQAFNAAYPLHAAKVGGLPYRVVMTLCGIAMTLLGTFAVWSFWFSRNRPSGRRAGSEVVAVAGFIGKISGPKT